MKKGVTWTNIQEESGSSTVLNTAGTISYKTWTSTVEYPSWEYKSNIRW